MYFKTSNSSSSSRSSSNSCSNSDSGGSSSRCYCSNTIDISSNISSRCSVIISNNNNNNNNNNNSSGSSSSSSSSSSTHVRLVPQHVRHVGSSLYVKHEIDQWFQETVCNIYIFINLLIHCAKGNCVPLLTNLNCLNFKDVLRYESSVFMVFFLLLDYFMDLLLKLLAYGNHFVVSWTHQVVRIHYLVLH